MGGTRSLREVGSGERHLMVSEGKIPLGMDGIYLRFLREREDMGDCRYKLVCCKKRGILPGK